MSRPFAFWITNAGSARLREVSVYRLSGAALGRAPELGQALSLVAPFCPERRTRFRGFATPPRAHRGWNVSILIEPLQEFVPESLEGALLIEEGVRNHAFAASVAGASTSGPVAARFDFGEDRGYGLVRTARGLLDGVLVGGGLGDRNFWDALKAIEPVSGDRIARDELQPLEGALPVWAIPTIRSYPSGDDAEWLVLRSVGPVGIREKEVSIDGDWRDAGIIQNSGGRITQLHVASGPGSAVAHVVVPFRTAA